jgi:hypothetical protein
LFLREGWFVAALAALASIAEGAAIKWVADRRGDAVREERHAYQDVHEACQETTTADRLRGTLRLLGLVM